MLRFVPLLSLLLGCRVGFDALDPALDPAPDAGAPGAPGAPDAPINACAAATSTCVGDSVRVCAGPGATPVEEACAWGCIASTRAHCSKLAPVGGLTPAAVREVPGMPGVR